MLYRSQRDRDLPSIIKTSIRLYYGDGGDMIQKNLEGKNKGQVTFGNPERKKKVRHYPEERRTGLFNFKE